MIFTPKDCHVQHLFSTQELKKYLHWTAATCGVNKDSKRWKKERKKVRWWETRAVHQTLTLIKKKKIELIYLFSTLIRARVCRQRPLFCLSLLAEQQSTTWLWFSHRSAGERSGPQHPALWHSDYVGTDPSWATPPLLFPGLAECNTSLTKSHFPFLSNFHTPTTPPRPPHPFLPRLARPLKKGGLVVTCAWHFSISATVPDIPRGIKAFSTRGLQTCSIKTFQPWWDIAEGICTLEDMPAVALMKPVKPSYQNTAEKNAAPSTVKGI